MLESMNIIEYQESGKWVVELDGRVDAITSVRAESALLSAVEKTNAAPLIVYLDGVTFMSSAGLRALLAAGKKARANGGELRIASPGKQVKDLFALSGFDSIFPVYATLQEACR
jgi:anti-anti-sigma factor